MKSIRSFRLVDYVKARKYCSLAELMETFKVSSATIHRDVAELVQREVFQRVRGGVAFVNKAGADTFRNSTSSSYTERRAVNAPAKKHIARQALARIVDGDILFLDSSTTVAHLAEELARTTFGSLTVVTNSIAVMQHFRHYPAHYVKIGLGGGFDPQLNSFLGQSTFRELDRLTITKAFISCFGIDEHIATTNHEAQSGLIARVLEKANRRFLLADRTKFGRTGLYRLAARGAFDEILADS
ncbi:MAG: DeoR/GlpR family DNA-binding transcription regulator [Kiritimatiellia bacterium]